MKKTHIPASPFYMYLTAIPLIIILVLSIISNSSSEGLLKLYPLILATAAAIIFILVYLFRYITVSVEEIKIFGLFSSRDKAIINKGKTLIMTETKKGVRLLTLFGNDGERPMLDWTQGEDYVPVDINLFRERIYGGKGSFSKILKFFDVNEEIYLYGAGYIGKKTIAALTRMDLIPDGVIVSKDYKNMENLEGLKIFELSEIDDLKHNHMGIIISVGKNLRDEIKAILEEARIANFIYSEVL